METTAADRPSWELYSHRQRVWFLFILFLVSCSNYVDRQLVSVLLEPIKIEFGASDTQMGLLSGFAFAAFYAVIGLPVAWLADRGNRRTVITVSLAAWSVMTMLCGAAKTFPQLFLARMGVGVGEAGAIPPAQSLIADYFPPEQRARALAAFMASATAGYLGAFLGGAHLAATYGWRTAFIALGAPGLLLCLLTLFGLREPRTLPGRAANPAASERLITTLLVLARKRSFVLICVVQVLYFMVAYGAVTWFPAYLVRVLKMPLIEVGAAFGLIGAVASLIGTVAGGMLTDRLANRDVRWLVWLPGGLLIACWPFYTLAIASNTFPVFLTASFVAGVGIAAAVPAMFTVLHRVCGSKRRAIAVAIVFFFANLLGLGFGPVVTGRLSDMFTASMGPVGLRYALMIAISILVPTGLTLIAIGKSLERDCED
jgi:MFS family permease